MNQLLMKMQDLRIPTRSRKTPTRRIRGRNITTSIGVPEAIEAPQVTDWFMTASSTQLNITTGDD